jgi:hypothetical protein
MLMLFTSSLSKLWNLSPEDCMLQLDFSQREELMSAPDQAARTQLSSFILQLQI